MKLKLSGRAKECNERMEELKQEMEDLNRTMKESLNIFVVFVPSTKCHCLIPISLNGILSKSYDGV